MNVSASRIRVQNPENTGHINNESVLLLLNRNFFRNSSFSRIYFSIKGLSLFVILTALLFFALMGATLFLLEIIIERNVAKAPRPFAYLLEEAILDAKAESAQRLEAYSNLLVKDNLSSGMSRDMRSLLGESESLVLLSQGTPLTRLGKPLGASLIRRLGFLAGEQSIASPSSIPLTRFLRENGHAFLVSIQALDISGQKRSLVLIRPLDETFSNALQMRYRIEGLRIVQGPRREEFEYGVIFDQTGKTVLTLAWPRKLQSSTMVHDVSSLVGGMFMAMALLIVALVLKSRHERPARF